MAILIDSSLLIAYINRRDRFHSQAGRFVPSLLDQAAFVPEPVLQEVFYVLLDRTDYAQATSAVETVYSIFPVVGLEGGDYRRMTAIMRQYASASFDFADAAIMVLAERLGIEQVATFDRRDFQIFRRSNGAALVLLPA